MPTIRKYLEAYKKLSAAARYYNTSVVFQVLRFRYLHNKLVFSLNNALFWGLTDPSIDKKVLRDYTSYDWALQLRERVNSMEGRRETTNKARFYHVCAERGLPIPETFGVLSNNLVGDELSTGEMQVGPVSLESLPDGAFVAKPTWGEHGNGLFFFEKSGDAFYIDGNYVDTRSLSELFLRDDPYGGVLLQRRLRPHEQLVAITGSNAIQTARIITFLDDSGRPHILFARFRIIRGGNNVDNFAEGRTGNLIG